LKRDFSASIKGKLFSSSSHLKGGFYHSLKHLSPYR